MGSTPVGEDIIDDIGGRHLLIAMDGRGIMGGACEDRDDAGDTVRWRDGGMSEALVAELDSVGYD